ncbi:MULTISPECIES: hypothetical protein [Staphylococcus]|uniref:hypothetical protein n=1 Tax=Staphylococcus TaxID=1279 RepID=UPI0008A171B7|nr:MULTISPECIES: hypothetical protein [Staphylococcus]OFM39945.1 hypothetical protein HMPREF2694_09695 [Staphylococcus sp. HMSC076B11]
MYTRDRETISTMLTNHIASERDSFRKQRDELINDMAEVKRKAEAFDEVLNCPGGSAMDVAYHVDKIIDEYYKESEQ